LIATSAGDDHPLGRSALQFDMTCRSRTIVAMTCALFLLHPTAPSAQTRILVLTQGAVGGECTATDCEPGFLLDIDVDATRLRARTPIAKARYRSFGPAVTADSRFVIWTGSEGLSDQPTLSALDRANMTVFTRPLYGSAPALTYPNAVAAFYTQFAASGPRTVVTLTPQGERPLVSDDCPLGWLTGISDDGERLFMDCLGYFNVVSLSTATLTRISAAGWTRSVPNREGTAIFSSEGLVNSQNVLRRYDALTGAVLTERVVGPSTTAGPRLLGVDPRTGDLYTFVPNTPAGAARGDLSVLDGTTLSTLATLPIAPFPVSDGRIAIAFDRDGPRAFVLWSYDDGRSGRRTAIATLDTAGFTLGEPIDFGVRSWPVGIAMVPMPGRAQDLRSTVAGSQVTLDWTQSRGSGITTGFVLEVGLSPAATHLTFSLPPDESTVTATGVPPGRYYVRVRASNAREVGAASNEVEVVVPFSDTAPAR
jgi:hypothetical protein